MNRAKKIATAICGMFAVGSGLMFGRAAILADEFPPPDTELNDLPGDLPIGRYIEYIATDVSTNSVTMSNGVLVVGSEALDLFEMTNLTYEAAVRDAAAGTEEAIESFSNEMAKVSFSGDYSDLTNKPQINGVSLFGNKTGADLGVLDLSGGTITGELAIGPNSNYSAKFESDASGAMSLALRDSTGNSLGINGGKLYYRQYDWQTGVELFFPSTDGTLALSSDIDAAISPTSPAFSNAVLSVGLGIETNTVAAINELVDSSQGLPVSGMTSVGALLLALAAAIAALKRGKADKSDATLTERTGFSEWNIVYAQLTPEWKAGLYEENPSAAEDDYAVRIIGDYVYVGGYACVLLSFSDDGLTAYYVTSSPAATFFGPEPGTTVATRTSTVLPGYQLGDQELNPLASEAEAEALRAGKADRVADPTAGNLAALDASGNPTDSGKKASDFVLKNAAPVAIGAGVAAATDGGIAIGQAAKATAANATSIGHNAAANGLRTVAIGSSDTTAERTAALADYSVAVGGNAVANASSAVQIGRGTNLVARSLQFRSTMVVDGNGKIPAANLDVVVARAADVDPLLFTQYYPDGSVKSASEFTAGIKYDAPDTTNRTITVKPFCNTGDSENDNSDLGGRVVIPPFVDAQGNGYISDDDTRYKVVGVSMGSSNHFNSYLTAIIAPSTVATVGGGAFDSCDSLTSVSLPAATDIGGSAFYGCTSLTSVSLPAATTIRNYTFDSCDSLTSIDFGGNPRPSIPPLGEGAFDDVPTSCKIIVPYTQYDAWIAADGWSDLQQEFVRHAEKADKPAAFTTGNLAKFDANGNPTNSGWTAGGLARYALVTKTISGNAVTLDDRTCNYVDARTLGSSDSLDIGFPDLVDGKSRDFVLAVACGANPPAISYAAFVTIMAEEASTLTPEEGMNIYSFKEFKTNMFIAARKLVGTVVSNTPESADQMLLAMQKRGISTTGITNFGGIETALGLSDTATPQDAVDAVMN